MQVSIQHLPRPPEDPAMNARTDTAVLQSAEHHLSNAHLDALEEETIFILR